MMIMKITVIWDVTPCSLVDRSTVTQHHIPEYVNPQDKRSLFFN
jgi:hypothetical protein